MIGENGSENLPSGIFTPVKSAIIYPHHILIFDIAMPLKNQMSIYEQYEIYSPANKLRFIRPIIEKTCEKIVAFYDKDNVIPDPCLPTASKEIALTPLLYYSALAVSDSQKQDYLPAAEIPVKRKGKNNKGRLDLALFNQKRIVLIECKAVRIPLNKDCFATLKEKLRAARNQLRSIDHKSLLEDSHRTVSNIALVSASITMTQKQYDNNEERESWFWDKYQDAKAEFDSSMLAAIYYGPHFINGKLQKGEKYSNNLSIGHFFLLHEY